MQRLYLLSNNPSTSKHEFCIFTDEKHRNYRCWSLTDPDLLRPSSLPTMLRHGETCILEAEHITLDLIRQQLPEFFI